MEPVIWEFREGIPEVVTFEPGLKELVGILAVWHLPSRCGAEILSLDIWAWMDPREPGAPVKLPTPQLLVTIITKLLFPEPLTFLPSWGSVWKMLRKWPAGCLAPSHSGGRKRRDKPRRRSPQRQSQGPHCSRPTPPVQEKGPER